MRTNVRHIPESLISTTIAVLLTLATMILLSGCGGKSSVAMSPAGEERLSTEGRETKALDGSVVHVDQADRAPVEPFDRYAFRHFENALLQEMIGDFHGAAESYRRVLTYYPHSHEVGVYYAETLMRLGYPEKALVVLDSVRPQDEDVLYLKAGCYRAVNDVDGAKNAYLELVKLDPQQINALAFLANHYQRRNDIDSTLWAYRLLVKAGESDPRMLNQLGRMLEQTGRVDEAKEVLWMAVRATPIPHPLSVATLGELYDSRGQSDSAEMVFQLGLEASPDNILLHRELARLYFVQDSTLKALPHMRAVAELSPTDTDAARRLGIVYFSLDSLVQADSVLTALVQSGDVDARNHFYLGRIAVLQEEYERARDEFIVQSELAESSVDSWIDLGFAYRQLDAPEEESAAYMRGLEKMRDEDSAIKLLFALGTLLERTQKIDSAVTVFEEIIKHNPDEHQALNYLGYTLADNDLRLEYAHELISRAIELEPDNAAYLDSYGWVQFKRGELDDAVTYLRRAATLDNDPVILDHLGDALSATGEQQEARLWWQRALELQPDNQTLKEKLNR
ncbi:MAG: tetratricopeptide repeat protein [candidate division Zixibacteria bacterium]|nr:tetratricopeptide repeat protein [candidate division Zixibacteria bacterium]